MIIVIWLVLVILIVVIIIGLISVLTMAIYMLTHPGWNKDDNNN